MTYQHCPRCRLAIRCRASFLSLTNCPRCLARAGLASPLFFSPLTAEELRSAEPKHGTRMAIDPSRRARAVPGNATSTL